MDISSLRERSNVTALSVSELNNYIKNLIDSSRALNAVSVTGEISNFTDHRSGHLYFSLKDTDAQIRAVMFRSARSRLKFVLEDGMKVTVTGSVSVYPQSGTIQLYVNSITPDGVGALYKAYEQLKERLFNEGLFDENAKKAIPRYPTRIGVITSPTGAAVRDIINVTSRRYPLADIYLYPSLVQGEGAPENLIKALDYLDKSKLVDVIIIGRGGGSIEDLWAFNNEALARRVFAAETPIISAVGHETDFTICDFVADMRAPTPSAAAELSVPDIRDITVAIDDISNRIATALKRVAEQKKEKLRYIQEKDLFHISSVLFESKRGDLSAAHDVSALAMKSKLTELCSRLRIESGKAEAMSPLSVIFRGYAVAENENGIIRFVSDVVKGEQIRVRVTDGVITANVNNTQKFKGKRK